TEYPDAVPHAGASALASFQNIVFAKYSQHKNPNKQQEEEKQKMITEKDTSDNVVIKTSEWVIEDKGKAVASEHDPLVLILQ
ncbi:hypothetical protein A2U01_0070441, partial [Trifolium medium]|nr:hypothetical protein [Trifolium medium]